MTSVIYSDQLSVDLFRCCQELTEEKKFTEIICHSKIWTWLEILFSFQKDCIDEVSGPPPLYQTWSLIVSNLITLFIVVSAGGRAKATTDPAHQNLVEDAPEAGRPASRQLPIWGQGGRPEHPRQLRGGPTRASRATQGQPWQSIESKPQATRLNPL